MSFSRWTLRGVGGALVLEFLFSGCHTYEVRQFDSMRDGDPPEIERVAVIMATDKTLEGEQTKQNNKLFAEQLIVSLQQRGLDVAERQKVEALLVDSDMVESGEADLSETERAKRLGRLLKVDLIVYGDALVNWTYYSFFRRPFFHNEAERARLERQANETHVVDRKSYPVLAQHSIYLSARAVDTATGAIVWVGFCSLITAKEVKDDDPSTLTRFDVIQEVCDQTIDDLLGAKL